MERGIVIIRTDFTSKSTEGTKIFIRAWSTNIEKKTGAREQKKIFILKF